MDALALTSFGDPAQAVELVSQEGLKPGNGEVLVRLEAASINPSDIHLIRGFYGVRPALPAPLGVEGVGTVIGAVRDIARDLVGRRVVILPSHEHGTWAEHALIAADNVIVVSAQGDPAQLAMVGVNPVTAQLLLTRYGPLAPGDWIAQTGANSAVGQYVIRLAALAGLKTANLVRREEAAAQVATAGGDEVIVVADDLPARLDQALHGQELALVLDSVGGPAVTELAHRLRYGGQVVTFGALGGQPTALSARDDLIYRNISHHGFWIVNWQRDTPAQEVRAVYQQIAELVDGGKLAAEIEQTFPLHRYREALGRAEQYQRGGKILFTFDAR